jgi:hypothetical protein
MQPMPVMVTVNAWEMAVGSAPGPRTKKNSPPSTATASAAQICMTVLTNPRINPARSGETRSMAARIIIGVASPNPTPIKTSARPSGRKEGGVPAGDMRMIWAAKNNPVADTRKARDGAAGPIRRPIAGLENDDTISPADSGMMSSPACKAVRPSPVWR